jgi:hypothetical protein
MQLNEAERVISFEDAAPGAIAPAPERNSVPLTGGANRSAEAGASVVLGGVHVSFPIYSGASRSLRHHIIGREHRRPGRGGQPETGW